MRIVKTEDIHCDGGFRTLSFLKITTDEGIVGYAEIFEGMGGPAMIQVIRRLAETMIGKDPRDVGSIGSKLYLANQMTQGGMVAQAIGAIENACLDIKGKTLGVPVYDLYGGKQRDTLEAYWSHVGTYRVRFHDVIEGASPIRSLDDIHALGKEVVAKGYRAMKTNLIMFDEEKSRVHAPGFSSSHGSPALNWSPELVHAAVDQMSAFRDAVGPDVGLMLDLNTHYKSDGYRRMAKAMEPLNLNWLEIDAYNPISMAELRGWTSVPIASLETVYNRRGIKPFLDAEAADVCIIDVVWQGFPEAMKMAMLAETYDVNVAAHNAHGYHATIMGAHMAAAIPNFRLFEFDVDETAWTKDFFTYVPKVTNSQMELPTGPGWGCDPIEEVMLQHPPRNAEGRPWLLEWHRANGVDV